MTINLLLELKKENISGAIACFENRRFLKRVEGCNIPAYVIPMGCKWDLRSILKLAAFAAREKADVIHTHGYKENLWGRAAGRLAKIPVATTIHGFVDESLEIGRRKNFFYGRGEQLTSRLTDVYFAPCRYALSKLKEKLPGAKVKLVRSGVPFPPDRARPAAREFIPGNIGPADFVIGAIGRLVRGKGLETLIETLPALLTDCPRALLCLVGDGPLQAKLKEEAAARGIADRVVLTGYLENVEPALRRFDLFVMPSEQEILPIALLEAMASGKPVIASGAGGIPEVILDGRNGLLAPPNNPAAWRKAIVSLYRDRRKAQHLGERARVSVKEEWNIVSTARETAIAYRTIREERRTSSGRTSNPGP